MAAKDVLGRRGEDLAALHLRQSGFDVVERNWRCAAGEIDIIAREGDEIVFVEVKTRTSTAYGHPLESITVQKLARLRRLVGAWCETHPVDAAGLRIDAVAVIAPRVGPPVIEHIRGVF